MRTLRRIAAGAVLCLWAACAHAQLELTFDKPNQTAGELGSVLSYSGSLTNLSAATIFLTGDNISLDGFGLTPDDAPFLDNLPDFLAPNQVYMGSFFDVFVELDAPVPQSVTGSFTVVGGAAEGDMNELVTGTFGVAVAAPEPATAALLGATLPLCGVVALRRRKG